MKLHIKIMDHQSIDPIQRQPLQRLFIGPHDAIIGIVKPHRKIQPADPGGAAEPGNIGGPVQGAANLGGDLKRGPWLGAQKAAKPVFRQAPAIPGRGVEIAHARVPCAIHGGTRLRLINQTVQFTQVRRAKAEYRQVKRCGADFAAIRSLDWHVVPPRVPAAAHVRAGLLPITCQTKIRLTSFYPALIPDRQAGGNPGLRNRGCRNREG